MRINLHEIPNDGKQYIINRKTGELNEILNDLVGTNDYLVDVTIRPINHVNFQLLGSLKTTMLRDCSRCALDFNLYVREKLNDLLIPAHGEEPRNSSYTKVNHISDLNGAGPSVSEYAGHHFDLGEYIHETIAINEPAYPAPEEDKQGNCLVCKKHVKGHHFQYDEAMETSKKSPFGALKDLKITKN